VRFFFCIPVSQHPNRSTPVPEAGKLTFSPNDVLVRSTPSLVFSLKDLVKLLQVGQRGFVVVGPALVLRTLGLKTPGSSGFDHPDFALGPIFIPIYPGMAVVHSI
jgi:hypothetical protein